MNWQWDLVIETEGQRHNLIPNIWSTHLWVKRVFMWSLSRPLLFLPQSEPSVLERVWHLNFLRMQFRNWQVETSLGSESRLSFLKATVNAGGRYLMTSTWEPSTVLRFVICNLPFNTVRWSRLLITFCRWAAQDLKRISNLPKVIKSRFRFKRVPPQGPKLRTTILVT